MARGTPPADEPAEISTAPVPWYRRLYIRLALVFGAAILIFNSLREPLDNLAWEHLVSDQLKQHIHNPLFAEPGALASGFEAVLSRAPDGRWPAGSKPARSFEEALQREYHSWVWIDRNRIVKAKAADLEIEEGSKWPHSTETALPLVVEGAVAGLAYLNDYPLTNARGHLVAIAIGPGLTPDEDPGNTGEAISVVSGSPLLQPNRRGEVAAERFAFLRKTISIAIAVSLAALLALMVAWFITRRLTRLAREANLPIDRLHQLPGPFRASGNDEITSLAQSLNQSREKVGLLLEEVQERDKLRREWIAQVSHDIRTPLTALAACIERAESRTLGIESHALRTELSLMLTTAKADLERLNSLTRDLLESARLELDESLIVEEVLPAEVVRHTMATIRPLGEQQGVKIDTDIQRGLPVVNGDGSRLMRAYENVVKNAIQHAHQHILVSLHATPTELTFSVADDGDGLPERNGNVVLIARGKNPNKEESSGLGLRVAQKIAQAHHGRLEGANRSGGGAVVSIILPVNSDNGAFEE